MFGSGADQAFFVQCDATTITPADIAAGVVTILIACAPVRPAEFIIISIQQLAG
ncbi:MAG TPA: hypothetical protein VK726_21140 [Acetobacteraceae bacterium]|nr:hypothetical protein [Acetobacteraceae bacterium]